jgi:hypothetical protein
MVAEADGVTDWVGVTDLVGVGLRVAVCVGVGLGRAGATIWPRAF